MAVNASLNGLGIEDIEEAVPPGAPSSPQPIRDALVAGVVSALIGLTVAFWRTGVHERRAFDPGIVLGAPLLAQIPNLSGNGAAPTGVVFDSRATEAYQFLLSALEYPLHSGDARTVLITSASPGDGKSLTALHLARAMAVQGNDVVLVDSDIRARGLTSLLNAEESAGLAGLAAGAELSDVTRRYRISGAVQLPLVPAGQPPTHLAGVLSSREYRDAITTIASAYDYTIVDSAPMLAVADASAMATHVDGIVLVVSAVTPQDDLRRLRERLALIPTPILGYVINRAKRVRTAPYAYGKKEPGFKGLRGFFGSAPKNGQLTNNTYGGAERAPR